MDVKQIKKLLEELGLEDVLSYDIEVSYCTGAFWRDPWQTSIAKVLSEGQILTISWQWVGESTVHVLGQCDDPKYKPGVLNDKWLVNKFVTEVMNKAEYVIGQNSNSFDNKWINTRLFIHSLPPGKPYRKFDTKKLSSKYFAFITNKLDDLAKRKKLGAKLKHEGIELWENVMAGDKKAWKTMKNYNKHDVKLTTALWIEFIPWIILPRIKSVAKKQCPKCLATNALQRRGGEHKKADGTMYEKYSCTGCGKWHTVTLDLIINKVK